MIAKIRPATIVVPWSFSGGSQTALDWALDILDASTTIRVVHVVAPLSGPDNGALFVVAAQQKSQDLENRFRQQVKGGNRARNIKFDVIYGNVNQEIVRFSERCGAGLIVMASRKRKGISNFLFGHSVDRVVRRAGCPVFVLQGIDNGKIKNDPLWNSFMARPEAQERPTGPCQLRI